MAEPRVVSSGGPGARLHKKYINCKKKIEEHAIQNSFTKIEKFFCANNKYINAIQKHNLDFLQFHVELLIYDYSEN